MLKINLLPKSINIGRQRNVAIGVVTLLVAAEVGILLFMRQAPLKHRDDLNARKSEVESHLTELQGVKTKADAVLAQESALAPKYDFLTNMVKYNKQGPSLYRRIAAYTYSEATFLNLEASANQVKFDAYVANPTDVSRLLLGLSRSPDLQGLPAITGVPGWDEAEEAKRRADEKKQESNSNLPDAGSGVIGAAGRGGAPGVEGSVGGYPGGMTGGGGYPGGGSSGYPGGPGGGAPMAASGATSGYPGGGSMGGGGSYPGGGGGGQGGGGDISKFKLDNARRKPRGFTVNVTCALKTPLSARPNYADSDTQAGSGGGGGGGGYPGGASSSGGPPPGYFGGSGGGYPGGR
jgi:hypothetical protein